MTICDVCKVEDSKESPVEMHDLGKRELELCKECWDWIMEELLKINNLRALRRIKERNEH